MALSVIESFTSLTEAQIACGGLRAGGFDAAVLDQNFGGLMPTGLIGKFRLVVPEDELVEAKMRLTELKAQARQP